MAIKRTPSAAPIPIPALVPGVKAEVEGCAEVDDGEGELARVLVGVVSEADDAMGEAGEEIGEVEMASVFVNAVVEEIEGKSASHYCVS